MNKKITDYINNNFNELLSISNKISRNDELAGDLLQEIILQMYEKNDIILHNYEDSTIKYYIIKLLKINWNSKTSPFYYRIRKESQNYSELKPEFINYAVNEDDYQSYEEMLTAVEIEFSELTWFSKRLFELYLTLGSLKKVANQTQIPISSVGKYIKEIKLEIRENIKLKYDDNQKETL